MSNDILKDSSQAGTSTCFVLLSAYYWSRAPTCVQRLAKRERKCAKCTAATLETCSLYYIYVSYIIYIIYMIYFNIISFYVILYYIIIFYYIIFYYIILYYLLLYYIVYTARFWFILYHIYLYITYTLTTTVSWVRGTPFGSGCCMKARLPTKNFCQQSFSQIWLFQNLCESEGSHRFALLA